MARLPSRDLPRARHWAEREGYDAFTIIDGEAIFRNYHGAPVTEGSLEPVKGKKASDVALFMRVRPTTTVLSTSTSTSTSSSSSATTTSTTTTAAPLVPVLAGGTRDAEGEDDSGPDGRGRGGAKGPKLRGGGYGGGGGRGGNSALQECLQKDRAYWPMELSGSLPVGAEDAADCERRCAELATCWHFSFFTKLGRCHLADSSSVLMSAPADQHVVAASMACLSGLGDRVVVGEARSLTRQAAVSSWPRRSVASMAAAGCLGGFLIVLKFLCAGGSVGNSVGIGRSVWAEMMASERCCGYRKLNPNNSVEVEGSVCPADCPVYAEESRDELDEAATLPLEAVVRKGNSDGLSSTHRGSTRDSLASTAAPSSRAPLGPMLAPVLWRGTRRRLPESP